MISVLTAVAGFGRRITRKSSSLVSNPFLQRSNKHYRTNVVPKNIKRRMLNGTNSFLSDLNYNFGSGYQTLGARINYSTMRGPEFPKPVITLENGTLHDKLKSMDKFRSAFDESKLTDENINEKISASLEYIQKLMSLSSEEGLEWQQKNICRLIIKPLPVGTNLSTLDPPIWNTFYFDDLFKQKPSLFESFDDLIKNSTEAANPQDRRLIHMVQMSGAGKTHFAFTYARNKGGIVLRYVPEAHGPLFDAAQDAIESLLKLHLESLNLDFHQELAFLEASKRIMMLTSLTALELAEKFYARVRDILPDNSQQLQAFLRFIYSDNRSLLVEMFKRNLQFIFMEEQWLKFVNDCVAFAKGAGIKAIFLDEAHILAAHLGGQFIHSPTEGISVEALIKRVAAERKWSPNHQLPFRGVIKHRTSLLYVMVLAMETFAKEYQLAHVTVATKCSVMTQYNTKGRLIVTPFVFKEDDDANSRLTRFTQLLEETFGAEQIQESMKKHQETLKAFASRPLYLWYFFNFVANTGSGKSFEDFFDYQIYWALENAKIRGEYYYENTSTRMSGSTVMRRIVAQIKRGKEVTELKPKAFDKLIADGLIDLKPGQIAPNEGCKPAKSESVLLATDYFLRRNMRPHGGSLLLQFSRPK